MSKKCRPLFKKHESNKSLSVIILRTIDERNRTRPQSRQFIAQAARLSSRAAFVLRGCSWLGPESVLEGHIKVPD
jgi:hypothetical protein